MITQAIGGKQPGAERLDARLVNDDSGRWTVLLVIPTEHDGAMLAGSDERIAANGIAAHSVVDESCGYEATKAECHTTEISCSTAEGRYRFRWWRGDNRRRTAARTPK